MKKILYVVNDDWAFCNYRLSLAQAARDAGYEVCVAAPLGAYQDKIQKEGFKLIPIKIKRGSINPLNEIQLLFNLIKIYRKEKPDIAHHITIKPIIYGSIAARVTKIKKVINAFTGLGYIFSSDQWTAKILKKIIVPLLKYILRQPFSYTLTQNYDDYHFLISNTHISQTKISVVLGSGINTDIFHVMPEPPEPIVVTFVGRMLADKGVKEFYEAACIVHQNNPSVRLVLVGEPDLQNPASLHTNDLKKWESTGHIEWWGKKNDIVEVWQKSHIAVLPSHYREGIPRALLEAAACGRPLIATDIPGSRELVKNNEDGFLIPAKDSQILANVILKLVNDKNLRIQMGLNARKTVEEKFSEKIVVQQILEIYQKLL